MGIAVVLLVRFPSPLAIRRGTANHVPRKSVHGFTDRTDYKVTTWSRRRPDGLYTSVEHSLCSVVNIQPNAVTVTNHARPEAGEGSSCVGEILEVISRDCRLEEADRKVSDEFLRESREVSSKYHH